MKKIIFIHEGTDAGGCAGKSVLAKVLKIKLKNKADIIQMDNIVAETAKLVGNENQKPLNLSKFYPKNKSLVLEVLNRKVPQIINKNENEIQIIEGIYSSAITSLKQLGIPIIDVVIYNPNHPDYNASRKLIINKKIINNYFMHYHNINFLNEDVFNFKESGYDIIIHFSAFHYFREKQRDFLSLVFDKLNKGGLFLVEFGVSTQSNKMGHVEKYRRNNSEEPCYYPNRITLQKWISEAGLSIINTNRSVDQAGDKNPRFFYGLIKE